MSITTQQLYDGVLSHLRVQGGHPLSTNDYISKDGCRCAKGVWMTAPESGVIALGDYNEGWQPNIEAKIGRPLTEKEQNMFQALEYYYEELDYPMYSEDGKMIPLTKKVSLVLVYIGSGPGADFIEGINEELLERADDASFEDAAKLIAKRLGLKYSEPGTLPAQETLEVREANSYLWEELQSKKALLYLKRGANHG